jgi:hypothetical protein
MKIYEVMLKEAEAAAPEVTDDHVKDYIRRQQATDAANAAHERAVFAAGSVEAGLLHQGGLPQMGEYLRQQYDMKKNTRLKKTGSKEVDDMLRVMGFKV